MLGDGEIVEQLRLIGNEREPRLGGHRVALQVDVGNANASRRGLQDAGEGAQGGGFAGPVGTHQPEHVARRHAKRQRLHGHGVAIQLGVLDHVNHEEQYGVRGTE